SCAPVSPVALAGQIFFRKRTLPCARDNFLRYAPWRGAGSALDPRRAGPEELLSHRFAEGFISQLEPRCVYRFCVFAGHIAQLVLSVSRGFVHYLSNLLRR